MWSVINDEIKGKKKITIRELKTNSAPGYDGISVNDLNLLDKILVPILCNLFNNSLERATFPNCLKNTTVVPIYKDGGDVYSMNNYRPISLIPIIGLFEKLINKRIVHFVRSTVSFDKNQFWFQSKSSTDAALSQVIQNINKFTDLNEYVAVLFIDLRKAFDLLNHQLLANALKDIKFMQMILVPFITVRV